MSDLRELLKEEYRKKQKAIVNPQSLMKMIEEMMDNIPTVLTEEDDKEQTRAYNIKYIPLVPISELGWANNEDGKHGGTQRSLIENWLKGVQGDTFEEKLNNVSLRMKEGFGEIPKTGTAEYIQEVMSYLVFVKTLTMAITNFNASAAGFNFESFLAALMGGSQIPAAGAKTIADFVANIGGQPTPISLKLYTKGQLEVGGSFFDLANDMIHPNEMWSSNPEFAGGGMMYLVCTKDFTKWKEQQKAKGGKEDPLSREGAINFYQFPITRQNLFSVLGSASGDSRKCIASSVVFMEQLKRWDADQSGPVPSVTTKEGGALPARRSRGTIDEILPQWIEYMNQKLAPLLQQEVVLNPQGEEVPHYSEEQIGAIVNSMGEVYQQTLTNLEAAEQLNFNLLAGAWDPSTNTIKRSTKAIQAAGLVPPAEALVSALEATGHSPQKGEIGNIYKGFVEPAFGNFKKEVLKMSDAFGAEIEKIVWQYDATELANWYNPLSPEAKAVAISNTRGYLAHSHWKIPDAKSRAFGSKTDPETKKQGPIASIEIGARHIQKLLDSVRGEIMDEVFSIFDNMAKMSDQLNSFFANGLKEPQEAKTGAEAGEKAAEKAKKVAGV